MMTAEEPISQMLYLKEVASLLQYHPDTVKRMLRDEQWRIRLGAKKLSGEWRFVRWRIEMVCHTSADGST